MSIGMLNKLREQGKRSRKKIYFIGIGGIGMSALAKIALQQGYRVLGSDASANKQVKELRKIGCQITIGHLEENILEEMIIVYSSAIDKNNPEITKAKSLGCRILHRSDFLLQLLENHRVLSVTGTHGKTSTSALLASVLLKSDEVISYAIGGVLKETRTNGAGARSCGGLFVIEADESDGSFTKYSSEGAIITNIDLDHMDYYKTEKKLLESFEKFSSQVEDKRLLFYCGDDTRLKNLQIKGISYGFGERCELRIVKFEQKKWEMSFDLFFEGKYYTEISLSMVGRHNVLNAAAVFGLSLQVGIPETVIRKGLQSFKGVKRRADKKGGNKEVLIIDDYAHHPLEVKTTLDGIRKAEPERFLIGVFQPHRYSRMRDCLDDFNEAFDAVDLLVVTDVYSAGETENYGLSSKIIFDKICKQSGTQVLFLPRENLVNELVEKVLPNSVLVTLGAGDITKVSDELALVFNGQTVYA